MDDKDVLGRIAALVAEEDALHARATGPGLTDDEHHRITEIDKGIDQCWDLLRQRRALRDAGRDPDAASARSTRVVEDYRQ